MNDSVRRKKQHTYQLLVDPDRLNIGNTLRDMVLKILIRNGGKMTREKLLLEFEKSLKRSKSYDSQVPPSSLLSRQQRILQDAGVLRILDANGTEVTPRTHTSLLK